MRVVLVAAAALLLQVSPLVAQTPDDPGRRWGAVPAFFPVGGELSLISGDPTKAVLLEAFLRMPDGYRISPYTLPHDEHLQVVQGTLLVGVGPVPDPRRTATLQPGDTATAPAGAPHYFIARGRTIIRTRVMGPYDMKYVNPKETPGQPFPAGY